MTIQASRYQPQRIRRIVDTGVHADQPALPFLFSDSTMDIADIMTPPAAAPRVPVRTDDLRSELAIALDASCEYRLPQTTRSGMVVELMARKLYRDGDTHFPGWDIRMNYSWNKSGRTRDGLDVARDHDERWNEEVVTNPEIFLEACEKALEPWVEHNVDLLDMDGALECSFDLLEPCRETLILKSFAGSKLGFDSRQDWSDFVKGLDDDRLSDLWMSLRVLDADLSRRQRAEMMAHQYNLIRHAKQEDWDMEIESLSF